MSNVLVGADHSVTAGRTRALNIAQGGQQGAMSDPKRWVSSASYTRQKIIAVLVEAPGHMKLMDDGPDRIAMLKSLVEVMATSITGLTSKLDVNFGEHKVNNAGEVHHTPTKVNRAVSVPTFVWPEKEGKVIHNLMSQWITELVADPETGHPALITKDSWNQNKPEFLPDAISMTVLFIEPSRDLSKVTSAWLCSNMIPKTSGEDEGKRVIGEDNETVEHTIEFTATTQIGTHVDTLAQTYLDALVKTGFQPAALPAAYDKISSDVLAGGESYASKVEEVSESAG
jgi:hypothetical protein